MSFIENPVVYAQVPSDVFLELADAYFQFDLLGLKSSKKWCAEFLFACRKNSMPLPMLNYSELLGNDLSFYFFAKSVFDNEEYKRAAYILKNAQSIQGKFLYFYSLFLAQEKNTHFTVACTADEIDVSPLVSIREEMLKTVQNVDNAYFFFLRGLLARALKLEQEAIEYFEKTVHVNPYLWSAWTELASLLGSREQLMKLNLPIHWVRDIFYVRCFIELQFSEEALKILNSSQLSVFEECSFLNEQKAAALNNMRESELAKREYVKLHKADPYNLDFVDLFSNILFVLEEHALLSALAQECTEIDKYRYQTCCVIGNYYSMINDHIKAIQYFQRALKLNNRYVSAWTLIGHECMELKHYSSAIYAYRKAIEINRKEFRAWYGLGQTYEILRMHKYSVYYYTQVYMIRPNDARFVIALGDAYEKIGRLDEAKRCYWKAHCVGDSEGIALPRLAQVYESNGDEVNAVQIYLKYISHQETSRPNYVSPEMCDALRFVGRYYISQNNLDGANRILDKCLQYPEMRDDIKSIIAEIANFTSSRTGAHGPSTSSA